MQPTAQNSLEFLTALVLYRFEAALGLKLLEELQW